LSAYRKQLIWFPVRASVISNELLQEPGILPL
jgi:hypothetical protein